MGSKISKISSPFSGAKRCPPPDVSNDEDEDLQPPTKRRRLAKLDDEDEVVIRRPFGQVTNESSRQHGPRPVRVQPSDFYGKTRSNAPGKRLFAEISTSKAKSSGRSVLFKQPLDFKRSLRVDIIGIGPKLNEEDVRMAIKKSLIKIKVNMLVSIFGRKNDTEEFVERCRRSRLCTLEVTLKNGIISRDFDEPQSFIFLPHELYMNRKVKGDEFDYTYSFADRYSLQVILEPVGYQKSWPPVEVPSAGDLENDTRDFAVSRAIDEKKASWTDVNLWAETKGLMTPGRQIQTPELKACFGPKRQTLNDVLNLKFLWALPSHLSAAAAKWVKAEPSVEVPDELKDVPEASPRKSEALSVPPESPAHSRGQRSRQTVATYNLKALSAQAQGRSPRKRKPQENNSSTDSTGVTVSIKIGGVEAEEYGVVRECKVDGLVCPFCRRHNKSVNLLTFHLQNEHHNWKFRLAHSPPQVQYVATLVKSRPSDPSQTLNYTKPRTIFELDKYLSGDDTWVKKRCGPNHDNGLPQYLLEGGQESSLSSSSRGSRFSSPNTSNDTDDMMDLESRLKTFSATLPVRSEKRLYVPKTAKPLYDTITKRILQPGEELSNSDDEKEESWLIYKHRDIINDYSDLADEEKEYINLWNPFIMKEHLVSDEYLPDALQRFVLSNNKWLAASPKRIREFQKHCQSLKARDTVSHEVRRKCMIIIREAKTELDAERQNNKGKEAEQRCNDDDVWKPTFRGPVTCICMGHTALPDRVICAGKDANVSSDFLYVPNFLSNKGPEMPW